jgi:hypothetical protein
MSQIKGVVKDWLWISSTAFGLGFCIGLSFNRDLKQAIIVASATVPATSAAVLIIQQREKREVRQDLMSLHAEIHELESQKKDFLSSIVTATTRLEQLHFQTEGLKSESVHLGTDLAALKVVHQSEFDKLADLENRQQEYNNQIDVLTAEFQVLEGRSHTEQQSLQAVLVEKQVQESELAKLRTQIRLQQQRIAELDASVAQKQVRQQRLVETVERLQTEKQQLEAQMSAQISQREELRQEFSQSLAPQELTPNLDLDSFNQFEFDVELYSVTGNDEDIALLETEIDELTLVSLKSLQAAHKSSGSSSMLFSFERPSHTRILWQEKLLPYWKHCNLPAGSRFLGSFRIQKPATDELLSLVGENLRKIGSLTQARLSDHFVDPEENWVKIVTLALSEYAYYYSGDRFWEGFCSRLGLGHSQNAENALREIADRGADLLGLVRAKGGYRYVSTLWLQSGIPRQNLDHFAQLVQELQETYGWEHLAEAEHSVLAEILFDTCQTQHREWGTLKHFLEKSCASSDNANEERVDPISGQLVQGIAVVAQELERQQLSPQVLLNDEEREAFLGNSYLPKNFFLRSWETLTKIITRRDSTSTRRRVVSLRPKRLFLEMNLESLDTQLVLPEQMLWQPKWKDLRGTNCTITEAGWEETMPREGHLEIPELVMPVESETQCWECTLRNHNSVELHKWQLSSISPELPCLIFDSITGEHIPLSQSESVIIGASEILCFTPKDTVVQPGLGIECRDRGIPSSLRGWRGVHLELTASEALITLRQTLATELKLIQWKTRPVEPVIQGLRLQGKQPIYLEAPTLWLPPMAQETKLNLLIDDVIHKSVIARSEAIAVNQWRSLSLNEWLKAPGRYEVKLWNVSYRWSHRFEIREKYYLATPVQRQPKIRYDQNDYPHLPIQVETTAKFWAAQIQINGLWPMEYVTLLLGNKQDKVSCSLQADRIGMLDISVAQFYELLPRSESYTLSYQVSGQEKQPLIEVAIAEPMVSITWTDSSISIFGLTANQTYALSCWNLLMPKQPAIEMIFTSESNINIPLELPDGIYHVQLVQNNQRAKGLGWWCNYRDQYSPLPEEINGNSEIENYWYIILGNEPKDEFIKSVSALDLDLGKTQLEWLIEDLKNYCCFPEWLIQESILAKLDAWLLMLQQESNFEPPKVFVESSEIVQRPLEISPIDSSQVLIRYNWYLITVVKSKKSNKRDIFCQRLDRVLKQKNIEETGILEFKPCSGKDYTTFVLVKVQNFVKARITLRNIEHFIDISRKTLTDAEASRMVGEYRG